MVSMTMTHMLIKIVSKVIPRTIPMTTSHVTTAHGAEVCPGTIVLPLAQVREPESTWRHHAEPIIIIKATHLSTLCGQTIVDLL